MQEKEEFKKLNTLCLFSGGGGLSKGLEDSGNFETIAFCDNNPFRQSILHKNNPKKFIFTDLKELGYANGNITYRGKNYIEKRIDAVCGGWPCQPFSNAGNKKGKEDDRDLWPEMFRVITETSPAWVIGENVDAFVGMEFTRTKVNLESLGYIVQPFILPACSVGAQSRRYRIFIIACKQEVATDIMQTRWGKNGTGVTKENLEGKWESDGRPTTPFSFGHWWGDKPELGRDIYGLSVGLDKAAERIRKQRVELLGDSVVPPLAQVIGDTIGRFIRG